MPTNDAKIGNAAGYESLKFTEDGGFVVGGFTKYEGSFKNPKKLKFPNKGEQLKNPQE